MILELGWWRDQDFRAVLCHINYFETRMGCMLKTVPQKKCVCGSEQSVVQYIEMVGMLKNNTLAKREEASIWYVGGWWLSDREVGRKEDGEVSLGGGLRYKNGMQRN